MIKVLLFSLFFLLSILAIGLYSGFFVFVNRFPILMESISFFWSALGTSLIFFIATAIWFIYSLIYFKKAIKERNEINASIEDKYVNLSISIFFGIGVIYTAIGMQSALITALGGLGSGQSDMGAWEILAKLVNGGILTALTTTIIGGAGGYILKIVKQIYTSKEIEEWNIEIEQKLQDKKDRDLNLILEKLDKLIEINS